MEGCGWSPDRCFFFCRIWFPSLKAWGREWRRQFGESRRSAKILIFMIQSAKNILSGRSIPGERWMSGAYGLVQTKWTSLKYDEKNTCACMFACFRHAMVMPGRNPPHLFSYVSSQRFSYKVQEMCRFRGPCEFANGDGWARSLNVTVRTNQTS